MQQTTSIMITKLAREDLEVFIGEGQVKATRQATKFTIFLII